MCLECSRTISRTEQLQQRKESERKEGLTDNGPLEDSKQNDMTYRTNFFLASVENKVQVSKVGRTQNIKCSWNVDQTRRTSQIGKRTAHENRLCFQLLSSRTLKFSLLETELPVLFKSLELSTYPQVSLQGAEFWQVLSRTYKTFFTLHFFLLSGGKAH